MLLQLHLQCLRQGIMLAVTTQEFVEGLVFYLDYILFVTSVMFIL